MYPRTSFEKHSFCILYFIFIALMFTSNEVKAQHLIPDSTTIQEISNGLTPRILVNNNPQYFNLEKRMADFGVPGFSIATIEGGVITAASGYGHGRRDEGIKVDEKTVFQAGSISKSLTAVLVLKLHSEGKLDIDADICKYLKTWKLPKSKYVKKNKVTLRMLLSHTAGLKGAQKMKLDQVGYHQDEKAPTLNEVLDGKTFLQKVEFDTVPGERHLYSNQGFGLIQKIIEDITNEPFHKTAARIVLKPFKMDNSTFDVVLASDSDPSYAYSYRHGKVKSGYWRHTASKCSGGLYSTPTDLAKFMIKVAHIINGEDTFLPKDVSRLLIDGEEYGLGFSLHKKGDTNLISHSGRNSGFFAYMAIDQKTNNGYVMMTNSDDANDLFAEVLRGASRVFDWDYAKPKYVETIEIKKSEMLKFTGDFLYTSKDETETLRIIEKDGRLTYYVLEEDKPIIYPLGVTASNHLMDLIDGNTLEFIEKHGEFYKINYDDEYEYFRISNKK